MGRSLEFAQVVVEPRLVIVEFANQVIARSTCALRLCSAEIVDRARHAVGAPLVGDDAASVYFLPRGDVRADALRRSGAPRPCMMTGQTYGAAMRWSVVVGDQVAVDAAWGYATEVEVEDEGGASDARLLEDDLIDRRLVDRVAFDPSVVSLATAPAPASAQTGFYVTVS